MITRKIICLEEIADAYKKYARTFSHKDFQEIEEVALFDLMQRG